MNPARNSVPNPAANPAIAAELMRFLKEGLREDSWSMDWTAISASPKPSTSKARVIAKSGGIWVGEALSAATEAVARECGFNLSVKSEKTEGSRLKKGDVASTWRGDSRAILAFERPYLNLASYLGGMAFQTSRMVTIVQAEWKKLKVKGSAPRITLTRKTLPYYRDLSIHAVRAGGGYPHRVSLSGGVLIKENHISVAGSISRAIARAAEIAPHSLRIEVEVTNLKELREAVQAGAEIVMLDNFSPDQVREALEFLRKVGRKPVIEVSGGIHLENVREYVISGVDVISVGSITHSVGAIDLSLLVNPGK